METAKAVNYSRERAEAILNKMLEKTDLVIKEVAAKIPKDFPNDISQPIFEGMRFAKQKLKN